MEDAAERYTRGRISMRSSLLTLVVDSPRRHQQRKNMNNKTVVPISGDDITVLWAAEAELHGNLKPPEDARRNAGRAPLSLGRRLAQPGRLV